MTNYGAPSDDVVKLFTAVLPKRVQEGSHKCIHDDFDRSLKYSLFGV